jgi:hypothetical protein
MTRTVLLLCACLLAASCATTGQKYSETKSLPPLAAGDGRIFVYRTVVLGMAVQPEVNMDGRVVGRATPNGFFYVDAKPGGHEIVTATEVERKLSLTLDPGQTRYVRLNISMGFFVGHVYPELVDTETGAKEIQDCRYTGNPT